FTFQADDGKGGTSTGTVTITINPVNDPPTFNLGANPVSSNEDAGPQSIANYASSISAGPTADEQTQTVTFTVTNDNNALFSVQPAISSSGTLTYTSAPNSNGSANVTVVAHDDGGTANGGNDTSSTHNFNIIVNAVNDAPSFTKGADQTVLEDSGPHSVSGWATGISAGPADESSQTVTFNATNTNNALFSAQPAVASDGTLTYTSAPNANGTATVSVTAHDNGGTANGGVDTSAAQTFTITVVPVNDAPSFTKGADVTVLEDSGAYTQAGWATGISAGPADEAGQTVHFNVTNNTNSAMFSVQPSVANDGTLTFTPAANANGSATITINAQDDGGTANGGVDTSASQTFVVNVTAVNDAPSFTKGADQTAFEDGGPQTVAGWATAISAGPADESSQTVTFNVSNDNNALFSVQPAVASDGTLTYTPAANANGVATVTVAAHDDGGTANGGVDTSASQTFTITVTMVNDAPSFTKGPDQTVLEDSGAHTATGWATAISAGPANESSQTVTFTATNDNNALFSAQPAVASDGTLTFTSAPDANGTATVSVTAHDDGGTANGGNDTSAPQTFTITVTAVNDAPSFTKGADQTSLEDAGPQTVAGWATAISAGPANESSQTVSFIAGNDNNSLFSAQPAVASNGTLTYTAAPNANGVATVTVAAHDNGGTANGGVDTSASQTFTITVTAVNDAPSFTKGADQTVLEDSGPHTVTGWATAISAGPADESSQTVSFTTTNDNNALFSSQPSVDASGNLTFTSAPDANGTATVSVTAHDNGGTANGGVDTSAAQTFVITVTAVNDAPSFTKGPDESVSSDAGPQSYANWATSISAGPANESAQTVSFIVTNDNNGAFTAQPAVSSSGTLTFNTAVSAPTTTVHLNVTAQDNGGTANGGIDTSATQTFNVNITHANQPPAANPDSYDAVGNTELAVGTSGSQPASLVVASGSVLANDTDSDGDPLTASLGSATAGASVTVSSDGTFRYLPPAGFSGDDTFTYVVNDGHGHNVTGTVTIHVVKRVLYVKNNGGGSTGRVDSPYATLAAAQASSADNDAVYVFTGDGTTGGQNAGFTLNHNGERLIGEGVALTAAGTYNGSANPQLRAAGTAPKLSNGSGNGVTIAKVGTLATAEVSGVNITSATNNGVQITDTTNVTMSTDTISSVATSGVSGSKVVNFSLTGSTISGAAVSGVAFDSAPTQTENNLSGAVTITGNTISTPGQHGVSIQNFSGTIGNLAVTGNTISSTNNPATSTGSGIAVLIFGNATASASVTKGSLDTNIITNFPSGAGIQFQSGNSSNGPATVTGNSGNPSNVVTIDGNKITGDATNHIGTDAILVTVAGKGDGNFDVSNNGTVGQPITNTNGAVIGFSVAGQATVSGAIKNNVIVANNNSGTGGIVVGVANLIASTEAPSVQLTVTGNSISNTDGVGINAVIRNCSGSMGASITNNTVAAPLSGVRSGIRVDSGSAAGNTALCLQLSGNTSAGSGGATGIGLRKQGTNAAVNVYGIVGMSATSTPAVEAYVNSQNPAGGGTTLVSATSGFSSCTLP
ncbi:MAG TPA: Ig-like domain-containing protein, partial [Thermoanaerobaculia bacterium]|nr:Ig-like domain-containing protein [Thermoanaerobaculia bacterium]